MPTYEYHCPDCGHKFERFQSITAPRVKVCPACHKKKVHRLIGSGSGLIFKGSGFYITDYRSEGYKEKAKAESGSTESKSTDTAAKESKTPAKTDASTSPPKAENKPKVETKSTAKSEPKPVPKK